MYPLHECLDLGIQLHNEVKAALHSDECQLRKGCLQGAPDLLTALSSADRERCKDLLDGFPIRDISQDEHPALAEDIRKDC